MEKIKIMIVDDHEIFRDGIKALLGEANSLSMVAEAANREEAFLQIKKKNIDLFCESFSI